MSGTPEQAVATKPADAGGEDATARLARGSPRRPEERRTGYALVTGGAGFLGSNLVARLAEAGQDVLVFDSLARPQVEENLRWLRQEYGARVQVRIADLRDRDSVREAVQGADAVYHLAAQVAVTTSIEDPVADFEVNALGTLHLLEAVRAREDAPPLLFASTNKVYGPLLAEDALEIAGDRYRPRVPHWRQGIGEAQPLELYSPYGCSKGAAEQYVLDYARIYGLRTAVFRMSCLYGPRQFGTEDQGWVAHFLIAALHGQPITIYGDGRQVRDVLYVDDAVDAYLAAASQIDRLSGQAFNLGGGAANAVSLQEMLERIAALIGHRPDVRFAAWRPGDQRFYVSDCRRFAAATGWQPRTDVAAGLAQLHRWLRARFAAEPDTLQAKGNVA